jgi:hypothetical protein
MPPFVWVVLAATVSCFEVRYRDSRPLGISGYAPASGGEVRGMRSATRRGTTSRGSLDPSEAKPGREAPPCTSDRKPDSSRSLAHGIPSRKLYTFEPRGFPPKLP